VPPRVWVTANFKETQLRNMRPGQPATISVDAYPGLKLQGRVDSIQAGSGAAFSLLPPENATGNYVKVVQRVPVKIVLDEQQQMQRVLGPGMSIVPDVAVGGDAGVAFKVASIAVILAAGVIVGATLLIRRIRKERS
jgi:membrane fusion protein (multidrug efflux system)